MPGGDGRACLERPDRPVEGDDRHLPDPRVAARQRGEFQVAAGNLGPEAARVVHDHREGTLRRRERHERRLAQLAAIRRNDHVQQLAVLRAVLPHLPAVGQVHVPVRADLNRRLRAR